MAGVRLIEFFDGSSRVCIDVCGTATTDKDVNFYVRRNAGGCISSPYVCLSINFVNIFVVLLSPFTLVVLVLFRAGKSTLRLNTFCYENIIDNFVVCK